MGLWSKGQEMIYGLSFGSVKGQTYVQMMQWLALRAARHDYWEKASVKTYIKWLLYIQRESHHDTSVDKPLILIPSDRRILHSAVVESPNILFAKASAHFFLSLRHCFMGNTLNVVQFHHLVCQHS